MLNLMNLPTNALPWKYHDGGRSAAGYQGKTGDCVCRAIAIATQLPYTVVAAYIKDAASHERISKGRRRRGRSTLSSGVYKATTKRLMQGLGWQFKATMGIGTGCKVHLRKGELPNGRLIVAVSKHLTAVIDGTIYDTHDCSRQGTRCVYGYYYKEP